MTFTKKLWFLDPLLPLLSQNFRSKIVSHKLRQPSPPKLDISYERRLDQLTEKGKQSIFWNSKFFSILNRCTYLQTLRKYIKSKTKSSNNLQRRARTIKEFSTSTKARRFKSATTLHSFSNKSATKYVILYQRFNDRIQVKCQCNNIARHDLLIIFIIKTFLETRCYFHFKEYQSKFIAIFTLKHYLSIMNKVKGIAFM